MTRLDSLPPDQRAALALLLNQQRGYSDVARLLHIREGAVHDRAHAALAVLAPREARELPAERRLEIGDYLLGQRTSVADSLRTRSYLDSSPEARRWAAAIAAELAPLATRPLPDIPGVGTAGNGSAPASGAADGTPAVAGTADGAGDRAGAGTGAWALREPARALPSSRRAGAILLAVIAVIAGVGIAALAGAFSGSGSHSKNAAARSSAASRSGASTTQAKEGRRITLRSPNPASSAVGVAQVLSEGKQYAFYMAAEHLPPSKGKGFFYAVWLYNSPSSAAAVSKSPEVGPDGRMQGGALLPANAGRYRRMILTRETGERPSHPGPIVLSGSFGLH
jgi:hypothetical protein